MYSDHSAAPRHMEYQNTRKALESTQVMRFFERTSPTAQSARRPSARPASATGASCYAARTPQANSRKSCWDNLIERTAPTSSSLQRGQYAHSSTREIESNNSKRTIIPTHNAAQERRGKENRPQLGRPPTAPQRNAGITGCARQHMSKNYSSSFKLNPAIENSSMSVEQLRPSKRVNIEHKRD